MEVKPMTGPDEDLDEEEEKEEWEDEGID